MRAFGCLFPLAFLVLLALVAGAIASLLAGIGLLGPVGPLHVAIVAGFVLILVVAGVLSVGGGLRRTGRTLDDLVDAARAVEAGDYDARVEIPTRGPRALRDLVHAFDTMTRRLAADERERRSLLADVSHELRTPLAVIRGSLEAIVDGVHPADEAHLAAIVEETRVMERLVEDLRTLALAEGGTLPLHPEPTDLADLVRDVVASFAATAAAGEVALVAEVPDLPLARVDPVRIREVVANLVANALRHTPAGGRVLAAATVVGESVELRVADTGAGIDPALLPHVFDRFVKTPGSGGSGLGLAIARNLVAAHGGTITVDSRPGDGSTFTVTLPLAGPAADRS
jgi:two-component system sensor histidine kinase BaeS